MFVVHGLTASFFTRKVTGYLDYKGLRWRLSPRDVSRFVRFESAGFLEKLRHRKKGQTVKRPL